MKKLALLLPIFLIAFTSCKGQNNIDLNALSNSDKELTNKIEVLEFYGKHRCATCINIEANTKFTINEYFSKELEAGKIVYHLINFDDKKNEKIVEKYGAYGTSLYITTTSDNKENIKDITNFAFLNSGNKEKFSQKLKEKIAKQLNKL